MKQFYHTFRAFTGPVTLVMEEERLKWILLLPGAFERYRQMSGAQLVHDPILLQEPVSQLQAYFEGDRQAFSLALTLEGPEFTREVWQTVSRIPYGQVRSYAQVARAVGRPNAYRAVGQANRRNPLPVVVPCHRVIGSNGHLVGYGGSHLDIKQLLLDHERKHCPGQVVDQSAGWVGNRSGPNV